MFTSLRRFALTPLTTRRLLTFCNGKSPFARFEMQVASLPGRRWESLKPGQEEYGIQDHLLQLTKEVENYFRFLAEQKASTPGIKRILTRLAEDEVKTYEFIENLQCSSIPFVPEEGGWLKELAPFYQIMSIENLNNDDRDEIHVYTKARDAKGKLRDMFFAQAEKCTDPKAKAILHLAGRQADKHYQVLDETVEYVAKAEPGTGRFATCPEFYVVENTQFSVSLDAY